MGTSSSTSWGSDSGTLRADQGRQAVRVVPARDQQTGTEQDQRRGAVMATALSHTPDRKGPRTKDQPDRAGLDAVLWGLLPVGPASPPGTHQRLPDAVDPQETRATAGQEKGPNRVEPSRQRTTTVLRALGLDQLRPHSLVTRTTRAV